MLVLEFFASMVSVLVLGLLPTSDTPKQVRWNAEETFSFTKNQFIYNFTIFIVPGNTSYRSFYFGSSFMRDRGWRSALACGIYVSGCVFIDFYAIFLLEVSPPAASIACFRYFLFQNFVQCTLPCDCIFVQLPNHLSCSGRACWRMLCAASYRCCCTASTARPPSRSWCWVTFWPRAER